MAFVQVAANVVVNVLNELNLDRRTIEQAVKTVQQAEVTMETPVPQVDPSAFGPSALGTSLGHHTSLAHQKFEQSVKTMRDYLLQTGEGITKFADDMDLTDGDSAQRSTKVQNGFGPGAVKAV